MDRLIRLGLRHGFRRGVLGGQRGWLVVGGVALVGRLARRALTSEPETVFSEKLLPGQVVRITHESPREKH